MNLTVSFGSDKYTATATALNLYRVKPLPVGSDLLNILCPIKNKPPTAFWPAPIALLYVVNENSWTLDTESTQINDAWKSAIQAHLEKLNPGNGQEVMKYLEAYSNDVWWPNGLRCPVYPFDVCNITQIVDRPASAGKIHPDWGQYWGKVQTVKYDPNNAPNIEALPYYLMSNQCDMNHNGQTLMAFDDSGRNVQFPRISTHDVWVNMDCVEEQ